VAALLLADCKPDHEVSLTAYTTTKDLVVGYAVGEQETARPSRASTKSTCRSSHLKGLHLVLWLSVSI
jgi:hypothetical protein